MAAALANPYSGLANHQFWRRSVAQVEPFRLDPVVGTRFRVARGDRVATAGSCFAQHISRSLSAVGFNYFVPESAPDGMEAGVAARSNYRVFSARFGNIYTTRQLVQLFHEAYGRRTPVVRAWRRDDGRFVDPYRPQIEPEGFADEAAVVASRHAHLDRVRTMFDEADVFVFTLGLTEGWRAKADGSVFPLAPGVAGGAYDANETEFVNFTAAEVEADLCEFIDGLAGVNPDCRIVLTVSPVPLIATYENRHVLVSTTYSKSVLRVAAEGAHRRYQHVDYFPSYEIITGNYNRGSYYEADLRDISRAGVAHAMRVFLKHYATGEAEVPPALKPAPEPAAGVEAAATDEDAEQDVVCDEEAIDIVRR